MPEAATLALVATSYISTVTAPEPACATYQLPPPETPARSKHRAGIARAVLAPVLCLVLGMLLFGYGVLAACR